MTTFKEIAFNIVLLTAGSFVIALGINSIIIPHGFITGGTSGISLLLYYIYESISVEFWYIILNVPTLIIAWFYLGKKFFLYTLYGTLILSLFINIIHPVIHIKDGVLAVLASGVLIGIGAGLTLHSKGSTGGIDIIGVVLNRKYNVSIGTFTFVFNSLLFSLGLFSLDTDIILYSLALSFCSGQVLDTVLTRLNQRKSVMLVARSKDKIIRFIRAKLKKECIVLHGNIAKLNTREKQKIVYTVIHNYQLKTLENYVISVDPNALMIIENTYNVIGRIER